MSRPKKPTKKISTALKLSILALPMVPMALTVPTHMPLLPATPLQPLLIPLWQLDILPLLILSTAEQHFRSTEHLNDDTAKTPGRIINLLTSRKLVTNSQQLITDTNNLKI
jgi:hypothetical protein